MKQIEAFAKGDSTRIKLLTGFGQQAERDDRHTTG
jgi:hypothetical protein